MPQMGVRAFDTKFLLTYQPAGRSERALLGAAPAAARGGARPPQAWPSCLLAPPSRTASLSAALGSPASSARLWSESLPETSLSFKSDEVK